MIVYKFISILNIVSGSDNLEKPNSNIGVKRSLCNSGVSNVDDESGLSKKLRISDDFCQNDKFDSESVSQNNNESFGSDNNVSVPEKLFCNQRNQATTSCSNSSASDVFSFKKSYNASPFYNKEIVSGNHSEFCDDLYRHSILVNSKRLFDKMDEGKNFCESQMKTTYEVDVINILNYCIHTDMDIIVAKYHCCYSNLKNCSYKKEAYTLASCYSSELNSRCFQIWFDKSFAQMQDANLKYCINYERYKYNLGNFIRKKFGECLYIFPDSDFDVFYNFVFGELKNNKVSILFFFTTLLFRIKHRNKRLLSLKFGSVVNLFGFVDNLHINIKQSVYESLDWWKELGMEKNNIEENIQILLDVVVRKFLIFNGLKHDPQMMIEAFLEKIYESLIFINE
ncbi:hypothetical protein H311_03145 [Anncaliia algerae PRA109]|nr:hypothetical protein H311_03145 [Anncaliia algerae PRA109]